MAIRRPPTTFSDTISTADIADDAITTAKVADDQITGALLANDIGISTTGNIVTTGSGALTVAGNTTLSGTNNLGSNPTVTLGANTTFPIGHVIQTASGEDSGQITISSSSYQDANLSLSITPTSSSNKIFMFMNVDNYFYKNGTDGRCKAKVVRTIGGTATDVMEQIATGFYIDGAGSDKNIYTRDSYMMMDAPNTTSAVTYKLQCRTSGATHTSLHNNGSLDSSYIILMEIKG